MATTKIRLAAYGHISTTSSVSRRARLDAELVRRGLARSREQAAALVAAGHVRIPGRTAVKAATQVTPAEPIVVAEPATTSYV